MSKEQRAEEKSKAENRVRTQQELLEDWTSTVINDLFDRFENST